LGLAFAAPLPETNPAAIIAALLAGKTVFTPVFFKNPVGFLRDKDFTLNSGY
jgi:hypothetical protein